MLEFYRRLADAYGRLGFAIKVLLFVGIAVATSALAIALVVWMPPDYFTRRAAPASPGPAAMAVRLLARAVKNLVGLVVLPLGVVMALPLVPGPGLVFMLIGLSLLDFPGKRRFERRLMGHPSVARFINDIRAQFGRAPVVLE